jgi:hypothetical protein
MVLSEKSQKTMWHFQGMKKILVLRAKGHLISHNPMIKLPRYKKIKKKKWDKTPIAQRIYVLTKIRATDNMAKGTKQGQGKSKW